MITHLTCLRNWLVRVVFEGQTPMNYDILCNNGKLKVMQLQRFSCCYLLTLSLEQFEFHAVSFLDFSFS